MRLVPALATPANVGERRDGVTVITREAEASVGPAAAAHRPFQELSGLLDEPVRLVVLDHAARNVRVHEEGEVETTPLVKLPESRETFELRARRHIPVGELNHVTTEGLAQLPLPERAVTLAPFLPERGERKLLDRVRRRLLGSGVDAARHRFTWGEASRADAVAERGMDPMTVTALPLGVDADLVRAPSSPFEARRRLALPPDVPIALVVAPGHEPTRATDRFCKLLRAHAPKAHVLRLGPRPRDPAHPREVVRPAAERPEGLIERAMPTDPEGLALCYAAADALVVPDLATPHPTRVLEALAAGLPCVITDRPVLSELVGDAGVVVPERTVEALAERAGDLVNNPPRARRLARTAQADVQARTWTRTGQALARAYEDLLEAIRAGVPYPGKT